MEGGREGGREGGKEGGIEDVMEEDRQDGKGGENKKRGKGRRGEERTVK